MRAALLEEFGAPEVLRTVSVPDPTPAEDEVLVRLEAAALNRRDTYLRAGAGAPYTFDLPLILGSDGAGVRADTGEEVVILPSLRWGASEHRSGPDFEILGGPSDGTYSELVAVPAKNVYPKPTGLSWEEAAALPLAGLTAFRALMVRAGLQSGETVLILGIGSGVSLFALLLARVVGARAVVTSSRPEKLGRAKELGADVALDYTDGDWAEEVLRRTGGADVVLDSVGSTLPDSIRASAPGGRIVSLGATAGGSASLDVRPFYLEQRSLLGTKMGSPRDFAELLKLVEAEKIAPVLDSVRPLEEAGEAHRRMERNEHFGKLVLSVR